MMQRDSVLDFVALRQQGRETDQPPSAQHLKLPMPRTRLHKGIPLGKNDRKRDGSEPRDASGDEVGRSIVNESRRRPNQAPASPGNIFDTDAEDLDESLTTSLVDATLPRQSPKEGPPSGPAAPERRAMVKYERHQILPTLLKTSVQSREADDDGYINSSSDGEPGPASIVSYSSDHEFQNGFSQMLRSRSLPGPTAMLAKTGPVPDRHSKKILQSEGAAQSTFEKLYAGPLGDQDSCSMVNPRDTATSDHNHQISSRSFSRNGKHQFDPTAPGVHGLIRDCPDIHEYSSNGQASLVSSPAYSTSGEPAGQENQVSGHNRAADRASLQSSRSGIQKQAALLKMQQSEVQPYGIHSRDLDYTWDELSRMDYSRLKGESFDLLPGVKAGPSVVISSAGLETSLKPFLSLQRHGQKCAELRPFFASLSIDKYEECGDLIIEGFKEILGKFKNARKQKRLLARKFEEKVQQRQYIIETKNCSIEQDIKTMRHNGTCLIPRSHSQKLDQG